MQVFLSWSGSRSHALASALNDYLPLVIQSVTPWFSPDDIDKGSRWLTDLTDQLQKQSVAIVCITPESVNSPWLLFEAGALSKALEASWVCPVLLDIEPSEIKGPLAQFQATRLTKEDIRKLLGTLNKRLDTQLGDTQIDKLHDVLWGGLEEKIKAIPKPSSSTAPPHRSQVDLLTEVLDRVRGLERRIVEAGLNQDVPVPNSSNYPVSMINALRGNLTPNTANDEEHLKFRMLYEAGVVKLASLQRQLSGIPESEIEQKAKVKASIDEQQMRLNSYLSQIVRFESKAARAKRLRR
jgi:hypothetical protein